MFGNPPKIIQNYRIETFGNPSKIIQNYKIERKFSNTFFINLLIIDNQMNTFLTFDLTFPIFPYLIHEDRDTKKGG